MKERVLVAMSGGIDSCVTAIMLHEDGYEVIGITMKTFTQSSCTSFQKKSGCCDLESIQDARNVATKYNFFYAVFDMQVDFNNDVVNNFIDEYMAGRTPNPCFLCNTHIKWNALSRHAATLQCKKIATGHYAQVKSVDGRFFFSMGKDKKKDQSYALAGLSQANIAKTILPLWKLRKKEVREYAKAKGFERLIKKKESQGICFIENNFQRKSYHNFLEKKVKGLRERLQGGNILLNGKVIGKHEGYVFFTIGQRNLGISLGYPVYIKEIRSETNELIVAKFKDLSCCGMYVIEVVWSKWKQFLPFSKVRVRIRYNGRCIAVTVKSGQYGLLVTFLEDSGSVAPGQFAVFYDEENDILFSGKIIKTF